MKPIFYLSCLSMAVVSGAYAQERTAAGALDNQMTWTALSNAVKGVDGRVDTVVVRVDQSELCGKKGMIYAPGTGGDGCIPSVTAPETQTTITNILNCNAVGQVYSQTTRTCINTAAKAPNCRLSSRRISYREDSRSGATGYTTCTSNEIVVDMESKDVSNESRDRYQVSATCLSISCN